MRNEPDPSPRKDGSPGLQDGASGYAAPDLPGCAPPPSADALVSHALPRCRSGAVEEALAALRRVQAPTPDTAAIGPDVLNQVFAAGMALHHAGATPRAIRALNAILDLAPGHEPSRQAMQALLNQVLARALGCVKDGRPADALRDFSLLMDVLRDQPSLRNDFGRLAERVLASVLQLAREGRMDEARRHGTALLEVEPAHEQALLVLAAVELDADPANGWARALRLADRACATAPASPAACRLLDQMSSAAADAVFERVRQGRSDGLATLLDAIAATLPDHRAATGMRRPLAGTPPAAGAVRQSAAVLLRWRAAQHRRAQHYAAAIELLECSGKLWPEAETAIELAECLMQRAAQDTTTAAWGYAQVCAQGWPATAPLAGRFHPLVDHAETLIAAEGIDHGVRTICWAKLQSARALVAYAEAFGRNPLDLPKQPSLPAAPRVSANERRVYDGFTFFEEVELLEVRLHELHNVVEKFILVEATHTHSGAPKPLVFRECRHRFAAYADKIVHIVADLGDGFAWQREARQRDAILHGLGGCRDDDLIIVSDLDEIPRRRVVERLRAGDPEFDGILRLEMELYFHFLNRRSRKTWLGAAVAPFRVARRVGTNLLRYLAKLEAGPAIPDSGWHFTWMGGPSRVLAKAQAYAHEEQRDVMVFSLTQSGVLPRGAPGREEPCDILAIDDRFPALVRADPARYRAMGWIGDER